VDHSYSTNPRTLKTLLDEPGPVHKAFNNKKILFLYPSKSEDEVRVDNLISSFPDSSFLQIEEDRLAHIYPYTTLACLMGASRVEIVHDLDASSKPEQYDAIVHEGENFPASLLKFSKTKKGGCVVCTDINWVRDCLITGTFLRHCKPQ
jgi:hypothetical protein